MKVLFLLNASPYGSDKNYNALRTAIHLQKQNKEAQVFVYLMSDAVTSSIAGQKTKGDDYNTGEMLTQIMQAGGQVKACTSCSESRGVTTLVTGAVMGTLTDLTDWITISDKVLTF